MKFKRLSTAILACAMCFGVFSTTAFAYVNENAVTEEPAVEEKTPEKEPEEPMEPLTPDGNMTLVDDEGKTPGCRQTIHYGCHQKRQLFLYHY